MYWLLVVVLISVTQAEKDYTDVVKMLKAKIQDQSDIFWHSAYKRLAYISDTFGPRMWGSQVLESVIDEMAVQAQV